jgi:glyoxylase-like metal-dependent hydrolase (beta-lactamase superfamily II)
MARRRRGDPRAKRGDRVTNGTTSVNIVSDGTFLMDGGCVFGQVPKAQWETYVKPDRRNRIRLALNCLLIQTPTVNILVDTGAGSKRPEKLKEAYGLNGNKLLKGLRALGLTARDIDIVLLTHFQFDHSGGCTKLDRSGNAVPTFPKAQYMVQRSSWEQAVNPNERNAGSFYQDDFMPLEEKGLLTLLDGDSEVISGVTVKVNDGPSAGHQIVLVERGSERVAYLGDLIPTPYHLPLASIAAIDESPNDTLDQKRDLLNMASDGGWLVIFGHGHEYRAGYVQQRNGHPQLQPVEI